MESSLGPPIITEVTSLATSDSVYVIAGLEAATTIDISSVLLEWEAQAPQVIGGEQMLSQQNDISRQPPHECGC